MDKQLVDFISVLRKSDVRVSTTETVDAARTLALVGYEQRELLRNSLSLVLAKTECDKKLFDSCFERFFAIASPNALSAAGTGQVKQSVDEEQPPPISTEDDDKNLASVQRGETDASQQDQNDRIDDSESADDEPVPLSTALNFSVQCIRQALQKAGLNTATGVLSDILNDDRSGLELRVRRAAADTELSKIAYSTQRALYAFRILQALDIDSLAKASKVLANGNEELRRAAILFDSAEQGLRKYVNELVEDQLLMYADAAGRELREELLRNANLSRIEQRYFETMQELVRRMAKKLVASHARRQRVQRRGQLDVPRTIRANIGNQGVLFNTHWKTRKKEQPSVFAICDVSGSVSAYAKFLLMFLYSLSAVIPKTRAFAFSSNLGEVSDLFRQHPVEQAVELANHQWGNGATDYGSSLLDFAQLAMDDLRSNSTVIIIGDARNNYGDPQLPILKSIYHRVEKVIWLNPEPKNFWHIGDSEMRRYLSCVHQADPCQTLQQLETIVNKMLRVTY